MTGEGIPAVWTTGKRPWEYALIPHDATQDNKTVFGLVERYRSDCDSRNRCVENLSDGFPGNPQVSTKKDCVFKRKECRPNTVPIIGTILLVSSENAFAGKSALLAAEVNEAQADHIQ